jgi:hypothetical protein
MPRDKVVGRKKWSAHAGSDPDIVQPSPAMTARPEPFSAPIQAKLPEEPRWADRSAYRHSWMMAMSASRLSITAALRQNAPAMFQVTTRTCPAGFGGMSWTAGDIPVTAGSSRASRRGW